MLSCRGELVQTYTATFNKEVRNTWQTLLGKVKAEHEFTSIEVRLCYEYEVNDVLFDDVFLYKDAFGTSYSYNSDGTLKKAVDDVGNSVEYSYSNHNLSEVKTVSNNLTTSDTHMSYDVNHNLVSTVKDNSVTTTYTYPQSGNKGLPTSVTVSSAGSGSATTTYTYCDNYNHLKSVTDSTGATTEYEYDNGGTIRNGLLTKVTDPNGNETVYTYNNRSQLVNSVSNPGSDLGNPQTQITYSLGRKTSVISNSDSSYSFSYNDLGATDSISLNGNITLITNEYDDSGRLSSVTYGNGSTLDIVYDEKNRVSQEIYDGTTAYQYHYNQNNALGKVTDYENGTSWMYNYDLAGRITKIASDDNRYISYSYNEKNETNKVKVVDNNNVILNTEYSYDEQSRPQSITVSSMQGTPTQSYNVDAFGRVTSVSSVYNSENTQNSVVSRYDYVTNNGNQTGVVDSINYKKSVSGTEVDLIPALSYGYDANGNITEIYENNVLKVKYYYDGLNRLVREDNSYLDKTVVYSYDECGDILSKTEYALTSSATLAAPIGTINYSYTDANYKNGLTLYNGTDEIIYDEMGNPTTYRGYSMVWTKAKRLSALSNLGTTMSFKYDCNGIRTSKTVNGTETKYTYLGGKLISQKTGNNVMNFAYTAGGAPYGFTYNLQQDVPRL